MRNWKIANWEVYTDGSCKPYCRHFFGGWAYLVSNGESIVKRDFGTCEVDATNQRMELLAAIKALEFITSIRKSNERVNIYSDSAYLVNCYDQGWYHKWRHNGWMNSKNEEVANKDLWLQILPYFDDVGYSFWKVKGHDKNFYNNECDAMAQKAVDEAKLNWRGMYRNG